MLRASFATSLPLPDHAGAPLNSVNDKTYSYGYPLCHVCHLCPLHSISVANNTIIILFKNHVHRNHHLITMLNQCLTDWAHTKCLHSILQLLALVDYCEPIVSPQLMTVPVPVCSYLSFYQPCQSVLHAKSLHSILVVGRTTSFSIFSILVWHVLLGFNILFVILMQIFQNCS